ncbi:hypothetical protein PAMP_000920 [Pampus punctatissimus]
MKPRQTNTLRDGFILIILLSTVSSENDRDWDFCGTWQHGRGPLSLNINLSTGCSHILLSANESSLSISGQITAHCTRSGVLSLNQYGVDSEKDNHFCLYWEPLLDQMKLQVGGQNLTLCWPTSLPDSCCNDLSNGPNFNHTLYGIANGKVKNDGLTDKTLGAYKFTGTSDSCSKEGLMYKETGGNVPCATRSEVEMNEDFRGYNITSPVMKSEPPESATSVHLPPVLKLAAKNNSKVVCTFFKNNSLFQEGYEKVRILSDVVGITVENEVIKDLPEPIRIGFHHDVIPQLEPRPVRHLLALTSITSLGCAVSVISCVALIIFLCRKSRRSKEQSIPIHLGLAVSLAFLNLLFFFTGVLANMGGEYVCVWVGAGLHYALLSSFVWMGIEVFNTFWMVYMVFSPPVKPCVYNLVGYVVPAVPVIILAAVGGIYGMREVVPSDDVSNPYRMCWMTNTYKALLAHYVTNMMLLASLVFSGIVMLFLVYRQIRTRDEWKQNRVAFLSIWGLSCLFGTTWGLTFLDFGPLSDFVLFLSCILNSFQGFFLMLRFYMLDWIRKQAGGAGLGSTSTGSTRQHMLQAQEKN